MYELVTKFNSLVKISDEKPRKIFDDNKPDEKDESEIKSGIRIDIITKYWPDKHPDIIPRILKGVGVDIGARDPKVNLKEFLTLNCILENGVASKEELIQFWTRILDPDNILIVKKENVLEFFNKLSQGRYSKAEKEEFSYAKDVWEFFTKKGCVSLNGDTLDITQLRKDLVTGKVDIQVFGDIFNSGFDPNLNK